MPSIQRLLAYIPEFRGRALISLLVFFCFAISNPAAAATPSSETAAADNNTSLKTVLTEDGDGAFDDAISSITIIDLFKGVRVTPDIRALVSKVRSFQTDNGTDSENVLRIRARLRAQAAISRYLRFTTRLAALCTSDQCTPNATIGDATATGSNIQGGDVTIDKAFLQFFRLKRFDLAIGRMQTKFVARGGVFAKSLDRNNSNGTRINWTDGVHGTFRAKNGWVSHFIAEYNSPNSDANREYPILDYSQSSSKVSYFFGFENLRRTRFLLQRALDISYLPNALLKNGTSTGPREDYYGIVVRTSTRWPDRTERIRVRLAAEAGYAPNTQTKSAAGISGTGDADGAAWNVVVSLMDFFPSHSIGFNYGRTGAGWLLSPQYSANTVLSEVRYQWRRKQNVAIEVKYRNRNPLTSVTSDNTLDTKDVWLRITIAAPGL